MINYLIVSFGAAFGGGLRYWLSGIVYKFFPATFPYGTLIVNILGSFFLGIILFLFDERELLSPGIKLFLTIGFCGGFTTFSTFSYETISLIRDSEYLLALANIFLNVLLCMIGIFLAFLLSKIL
jgi:fluoride exporter